METSILTSTQKYAAAALFALALHKSQVHQTQHSTSPLPDLDHEPISEGVSVGNIASASDDPQLWIHGNSGLLFPVFRFLGVDDQAWHGLEETAGSSTQVRHHVGSFLTLLSEECDGISSERMGKELALSKTVDAVVLSMETSSVSSEVTSGSHDYEIERKEKHSNAEKQSISDVSAGSSETTHGKSPKMPTEGESPNNSGSMIAEKCVDEGSLLSYERKVTVLYEILSACVADNNEDDKKCPHLGKGYDARHRVALRLLALWLGIKWNRLEAMEIIVSYSLMESVDLKDVNDKEASSPKSPWDKWKHGGIVGAAALMGGTVMAITGGLAAPAIAGGFSALAPTLGSIIPAIGASGFAAAASATGSFAGSVAVAASFGAAGAGLTGSKMVKRMGSIDEFEFKVIGKNHNQGRLAVGISIAGLVFEDEDFIRPFEGHTDNLEKYDFLAVCTINQEKVYKKRDLCALFLSSLHAIYALQWESENLIAVSTAIRDWVTSRLAMELMKEGAMLTVLSTLVTALALPATLLTATDIIDSKWAVALDRSDKAGALLAEVLLKGLQGNRPVTLVGFSLGARVIFKCLECLAEAERDCAGLVERVVLLGAPISIKDEKWDSTRKMVAGRFINAYSTNDWTLGIAFRANLLSQGLAGIQPVDVPGIENVDVTQLIEGHSSYIWTTKQILEHLDLDTYDPVFRTPHTKAQPQQENSAAT